MLTKLAKNETSIEIKGPAGRLEIVLAETPGNEKNAWGIVCHPHPLYGGTMDNKVVTTLVRAFQALGLNTVRFNFRGVGKSEGQFDDGEGELADLRTVIDWLQKVRGEHDIWLAGFSFGACIAAKAATQITVKKLVTVAPAVSYVEMQNLPPITCEWVLAQGEKDDVVAPQDVFAWVESREPKPFVIRFPEAGHFFHGELQELRLRVEEALTR